MKGWWCVRYGDLPLYGKSGIIPIPSRSSTALREAVVAIGACLVAAVAMFGSAVAVGIKGCESVKQGGEAPASGCGGVMVIHVKGDNWGEGRPQDIQMPSRERRVARDEAPP